MGSDLTGGVSIYQYVVIYSSGSPEVYLILLQLKIKNWHFPNGKSDMKC